MSFIAVKKLFPTVTRKQGRFVICALRTYSGIGGLQNFNRRLIENLAARTLQRSESCPLVFVLGDDVKSIPAIKGVDIIGVGDRWSFSFHAIWAALKQGNIFVICHVNLLPLAAIVKCLRPKMPILLFVHGYEVWNDPLHHAKRWYETWFVRALTRIVSVSSFTANTMAREFDVPRTKFRLLPNAVDPLQAPPDSIAQEPATILTVTRLSSSERDKNVDRMIRAVARLKEKLPGIRYEIIGDGALRPELEALARDLGVGDIVTFLGCVDNSALHAAYARATVFALLSSKEGFGIVYLEAWQRGLPVLCSAKGASKEIISDGVDGLVVDPSDISNIADRLHLLLTDPDLAKAMGERGRHKIAEKYLNPAFRSTLDKIVDELLEDAERA